MADEKKYKDFKSFYPYYLKEHCDVKNRLLHFCGTLFFFIFLVAGLITGKWWFFALMPLVGYGFAWIGHYFIEKNKPATFTYPLYSLASDFVMFWHIITGQINKKLTEAMSNSGQNEI
jgi:hypothetical protein